MTYAGSSTRSRRCTRSSTATARKVFALTLEVTAQRLREGDLTPADREAIAGLITRLAWDQLDIIDGVPDTLAELRGRHDLLLLTKGNHEEQAHKIDRSGLAPSLPPHRHHAGEDGRAPTASWSPPSRSTRHARG